MCSAPVVQLGFFQDLPRVSKSKETLLCDQAGRADGFFEPLWMDVLDHVEHEVVLLIL